MRREFNITGLCVPGKHYMVNLDRRLEQMKKEVQLVEYLDIYRKQTGYMVNFGIYFWSGI